MDFKDEIKGLAERVEKLLPNIQTEEATKNALIMPFIKILGYDVFNPLEVNPEYICDVGIKKGEKIDYAIMKDGCPIILIECKHHAQKLDNHDSQLVRYFHVSKAKFALLTNGISYRFYTDLAEPNKMDEKPFLEFNLFDQKEMMVEELKKFHKSYFDVEKITSTASELKYTNEIKGIIINELSSPSKEFVKFFSSQVYKGMNTERVLVQFTPYIKRAFATILNDMISERLLAAMPKEDNTAKEELPVQVIADEKKIETTDLEKESYFVVKSILLSQFAAERIVYRDAQSYFSVLLDDNNRKPLCRLYLNGNKRHIGVFDDQRNEKKHEIANTNDIYKFAEAILQTAKTYEPVTN
jgi:hypothetical protein